MIVGMVFRTVLKLPLAVSQYSVGAAWLLGQLMHSGFASYHAR